MVFRYMIPTCMCVIHLHTPVLYEVHIYTLHTEMCMCWNRMMQGYSKTTLSMALLHLFVDSFCAMRRQNLKKIQLLPLQLPHQVFKVVWFSKYVRPSKYHMHCKKKLILQLAVADMISTFCHFSIHTKMSCRRDRNEPHPKLFNLLSAITQLYTYVPNFSLFNQS
jgi:hypothetical protein